MSERFGVPGLERRSTMCPIRGVSTQTRFGVLVVGGELDSATAPTLAASLAPLLEAGGHVRVNARAVTFIGAAGLQVLIDAARALGTRGRLVVLDPSPVVRRAIELFGLRAMVDVVIPVRRHDVA